MKKVITILSLVVSMGTSVFAGVCNYQVKKSRGFVEQNGSYSNLPYIEKDTEKSSDYLKAGPYAEFVPVIARVGIEQYEIEILAKKVNRFIKKSVQCQQESLWVKGKYEGELAVCPIDSTRYLEVHCKDFQ